MAKAPPDEDAVKAAADALAARAADRAAAAAEKAVADELKAKYGFDPAQARQHNDGTYTCEWGAGHYDDELYCCIMGIDDSFDEKIFQKLMEASPLHQHFSPR